jgi:hypothetical protein
LAENTKVYIYADLLPDEYFMYTPQDLKTDDEYIDCPVCTQHYLYNSGTLTLRGKQYDMFTCDNCGEVYYGEPLSTGGMKLRFYSDTEELDPKKDVQDQFTQYLIHHKSVDAYKQQKSAFKDEFIEESIVTELNENFVEMDTQWGNLMIEFDEFADTWYVKDSETDELLAMFNTEKEAQEYAAQFEHPEDDNPIYQEDEKVYNSNDLLDRVRAFREYTGIAIMPAGIEGIDGTYVVTSNIKKGELKDKLRDYRDTFREPIYCYYNEKKDAYYIEFRT